MTGVGDYSVILFDRKSAKLSISNIINFHHKGTTYASKTDTDMYIEV